MTRFKKVAISILVIVVGVGIALNAVNHATTEPDKCYYVTLPACENPNHFAK